MRKMSGVAVLMWISLVVMPAWGQSPGGRSEPRSKNDYSQEAAVIEQYSLKI
jgi:hypothetical protein